MLIRLVSNPLTILSMVTSLTPTERFISSVRLVLVLVICSEALHIRRRISVSVLGGKNMTATSNIRRKFFFQDALHLCTFCAWAVVRFDQFVVFCFWLVLFVCTWLLFSSIFLIRTIISEFLPAIWHPS